MTTTVADVFTDDLLCSLCKQFGAGHDGDHVFPAPDLEVPPTYAVLSWHVLSQTTGDELRVESVRGTSEADAIRRAEAEHGGSWHVTTDEEWQRHAAAF